MTVDFFDPSLSSNIAVHKNNIALRRSRQAVSFTKEMIEERFKCKNDPIYFLEKYMKIINLNKGFVTIELYDFQKELIKTYVENRFTIAKLPRQVGKTTATVGFILWTILFHSEQSIIILANKATTAREILQKVKLSYESIPLWLQQGVKVWNKGSIEVENNSKIIASSTSSSAGRSGSYNLVFLDEFAWVPNNIAEEFMTSVYPTISSGTKSKVIMVSTPNGMNLFYRFWQDAINKRNLYVPIEAHYSVVPGRDEAWAEDQVRQLGQEKFNQEFLCDFLGSSSTLISAAKLKALTWSAPDSVIGEDLHIYSIPNQNVSEQATTTKKSFLISVDTSRALGKDYSAFTVIDITTVPYKIVAKYRNNKIPVIEYANLVMHAAKMYNDAYILIENNDIGGQICDLIYFDFEYENIFSTKPMEKKHQNRAILGYKKDHKLGVTTSKSVKNVGCVNLKNLIESDRLQFQDVDVFNELSSFSRKGSSYEAEEGKNDDLVMTLVTFSWLTTQSVFKDLTDENLKNSVVEQITSQQDIPSMFISSANNPVQYVDDFDKTALWTEGANLSSSSGFSYFKKS